ncbi:hypothetical protein LOD99_14400 [Oopsacas minuta]|uniref:Uncharacterized protein n=1 Tax=Oopsacas minuta TaxID=111878 RepID=A0AAV7KG20_9METZ|nr:hypothetical protein LOD99_14400 [Oopsacas minuta]
MLSAHSKVLSQLDIILASSSPRRKELCSLIQLPVKIIHSEFEEDLDPSNYPSVSDFVIDTAYHKGSAVRSRLDKSHQHWDLIVSADTVVAFDNKVIGKPKDKEDAINILTSLSGHTHSVCSGVSIFYPGAFAGVSNDVIGNCIKFSETTQVTFSHLTEECIAAYVDTGEPLDKAGGYGCQGMGSTLVSGVIGDYFNVVGLPVNKLCIELCKLLKILK